MHMNPQVLHRARPLVTGAALMITVALGTAAIVMWIPESPLQVMTAVPAEPTLQALVDSLQLQPKPSVLPVFMDVLRETFAH